MLHRLCTFAFAACRTTGVVAALACALVLHGGVATLQAGLAPATTDLTTDACCQFDAAASADSPAPDREESTPKPAHDCCVKGCAACCATLTQLVTRDATIGRPLVLARADRPAATTRVAAASADTIFHPPRA